MSSQRTPTQPMSVYELQALAASRWGIRLFGNAKSQHGPCPFCGGTDRFTVWPEGNYWCRQCGEKGWLTEEQPNFAPPSPPSPEDLARLVAAEEQRVVLSLQEWQQSLRAEYWRGWHDAMSEQQRAYWLQAGIAPEDIDRYGLGYTPRKQFLDRNEEPFERPAYTIPIRTPDHQTVINIQFRIVEPPPTEGKYRQESGIPAANFWAAPVSGGKLLVVEGAKKALVLHRFTERKLNCVGLPGITPHERLLRQLEPYTHVYIALDPGAARSAALARAAKLLHPRVRAVELPLKPDDAVLAGMTPDDLRAYLAQARRV